MTNKILLVTPPLLQPNTSYPATAYLKGYLSARDVEARQCDLSVELLSEIFTSDFLTQVFDLYDGGDDNIRRIYILRRSYISTIDAVIKFLRGEDNSIANLICSADFLPQASRFEAIEDLEIAFGSSGMVDCARYLATLYIEDISDFIRAVAAPHFELTRYAESISLSLKNFSEITPELKREPNLVESKMIEILEREIALYKPSFVGFSIPFPGNLLAALRCSIYIKVYHPEIKVIFGGGYPSTELRNLTDIEIFEYVDYLILDDGELPLERIIKSGDLVRTYTREGKKVVYSGRDDQNITHLERGCPDFSELPHNKYLSMAAVTNPMHRLWGEGAWNKVMAAHGCYWSKCAFCDTSLDYICRYDAVDGATLADWMERIVAQTGRTGFHFVDEALPPKLVRDLSIEIIRRGMKVSWWGNIRFESHYTGDLCQLMAAAGCIAVSGGVEVASDRLLELMKKGVSIEQLTIALRNFCYAGIMVHTYLMYGFPTQTYQEVVDSLEIVRQLFRAELVGSAFWHRYAMTRHSYSGANPAEYGVRIKNNIINKFANNEVDFAENRNYSLDAAGDALSRATYNYIRQNGIDTQIAKWFEHRAPETLVEDTAITDHLIKPDSSRIYSDNARIVWIGAQPEVSAEGLILYGNSRCDTIKFSEQERAFIFKAIEKCGKLENKVILGDIKDIYSEFFSEPFSFFYHSKRWDKLRGCGLLQV